MKWSLKKKHEFYAIFLFKPDVFLFLSCQCQLCKWNHAYQLNLWLRRTRQQTVIPVSPWVDRKKKKKRTHSILLHFKSQFIKLAELYPNVIVGYYIPVIGSTFGNYVLYVLFTHKVVNILYRYCFVHMLY